MPTEYFVFGGRLQRGRPFDPRTAPNGRSPAPLGADTKRQEMKIAITPKRTCVHTLRVTPAEADELTDHARRACVSVSELLRRRALGLALPPAAAPEINVRAYGQLARLAGNLNQAMHHANSTGMLEKSQFLTAVAACLEQVQHLRGDLIGAKK